MSTPTSIRTFEDAERNLAIALPGYESRPPQQILAKAIEDALAQNYPVLAEAGCGTGKSLGALIPAILSGCRVIYSTATKALQEQVANKDLPFLQEHLGVDFSFALLKGRANYFCLAKAVDADERYVPVRALERELAHDPLHSGDREHFSTMVSEKDFRNVAATSEECPGKKKCPFGNRCYAEKAKEIAKTADVVVVNHALVFSDVKVREVTRGYGSMLGDYDAIVFDEAHEIEDIATNAMAEVIRESGIRKLGTEVFNFLIDYNDANAKKISDGLQNTLARAWEALPHEDQARMTQAWFVNNYEPLADLIDALRDAADAVDLVSVTSDDEISRRERLVSRASNYAETLSSAMMAPDSSLVRWMEHDDKKNRLLKSAPLRVGPWLDAGVWSRPSDSKNPDSPPVTPVLISATLSVGGDFSYLIDRLGLQEPETLNVGTPFEFETQALLFVPPSNAPEPTKDRTAWLSYAPTVTQELVNAAGGGALLLYTSRSAMQQAHATLADRFRSKGLTVLMQGDGMTNKDLAKTFQEDEHSVLFALKSFFTGVDFAGDACRLVVIDKMPFPVPTDVMFKARSEDIDSAGGKSFRDLSIPMMTLALLQGFGRLIRTKNDRGVVAILDSRLSGKPYGRQIADAMPPAPKTTDLADVRAFYANT